MEDVYREWAKKSTVYWLERAITMVIRRQCDGTWDGLADARFVDGAKPQEMVDELVKIIYRFWWGDD